MVSVNFSLSHERTQGRFSDFLGRFLPSLVNVKGSTVRRMSITRSYGFCECECGEVPVQSGKEI